MFVVEINDLKKKFSYYSSFKDRIKRKKVIIDALKGINLKIKKGELFGLLGPNGAGKTTLINILSTILLPTSGDVKVLGFDVIKEESEIRKRIGVCYGSTRFYWNFNCYEILNYYGMLYGLSHEKRKKVSEDLIEKLGIESFARTKFGMLSTGMKQKIAIAKSLINDPELIFMDEPTIGLDVEISIEIRNFLKDLVRNNRITILLTSHNMHEIEFMCKNIAILNKGLIVNKGEISDLKNKTGRKSLEQIFLKITGESNV